MIFIKKNLRFIFHNVNDKRFAHILWNKQAYAPELEDKLGKIYFSFQFTDNTIPVLPGPMWRFFSTALINTLIFLT